MYENQKQSTAYANQATNQGLAGAQNSPPKRDNVQQVATDLNQAVERLAKLANYLEQVGDRLEGGRPQEVSQQTDGAAIPHSIVHDLRYKNQTLNRLITQCEESAQRITAALGVQL